MLGNRMAQKSFAQIPDVKMARSKFDRSHTVKTTMNFDKLTPVYVEEILPGDTVNLNTNVFARLSSYALKNPIMDNLYYEILFFFVPNRLTWDNWEKFMGAQTNPGDSTDYVIPTITSANTTDFAVGTIYDMLGIPTGIAGIEINALPLRSIYRIYNDWFRDQNLQNSLTMYTDDGPDAPSDYTLLDSNKAHDYFTSCLPWPQKGDAIEISLGSSAPVIGNGKTIGLTNGTVNAGLMSYSAVGAAYRSGTYGSNVNTAASGTDVFTDARSVGLTTSAANSGMIADLSAATASTINQLREAFMMQSLLELDARGGTRYVEIILNHFNVVSPDFRLQRPEFLGAGRMTINSNVVTQTAPTSGSNALGQVAAFGTASSTGQRIGFSKSFVEHGYVIGLARARADITYQQGLNRMWSRQTREEFFFPKLQLLGEQAVLNKEIYATGVPATDDGVFGYNERYAEYRFRPSEIRGEFRSTYATPLDSWHMAEKFASAPALNSTFIKSSTPIDRALAVTTGPDLLVDLWFQQTHIRPIVSNPVPATLGRF